MPSKEESEDEYVASSVSPSDHEDEASVTSSEDAKPPTKKAKKSNGSGGAQEKKATLPKEPWPVSTSDHRQVFAVCYSLTLFSLSRPKPNFDSLTSSSSRLLEARSTEEAASR